MALRRHSSLVLICISLPGQCCVTQSRAPVSTFARRLARRSGIGRRQDQDAAHSLPASTARECGPAPPRSLDSTRTPSSLLGCRDAPNSSSAGYRCFRSLAVSCTVSVHSHFNYIKGGLGISITPVLSACTLLILFLPTRLWYTEKALSTVSYLEDTQVCALTFQPAPPCDLTPSRGDRRPSSHWMSEGGEALTLYILGLFYKLGDCGLCLRPYLALFVFF